MREDVGLGLVVPEAETVCEAVAGNDGVRDGVCEKLTPGEAIWLELKLWLGVDEQLGVRVVDGVDCWLALSL